MSGSFRVEAETVVAPGNFHHERSTDRTHDHVVFYLSNGVRIVYNDPRRFGFMDLTTRLELNQHASFRNLGAEPLGNAFGPEELALACLGKRTNLKAALLDQRVVAGLGNIYVCEALHRAGLSPDRSSSTLAKQSGAPTERARRLHEAIRDVLTEALAAGGSTLRDHRLTDGSLGYFQHTFRVYDREGEPCLRTPCKGRVERQVQSGRSTFFCKSCQR
jgi:formamidopyrimidine-DNA glycosylase